MITVKIPTPPNDYSAWTTIAFESSSLGSALFDPRSADGSELPSHIIEHRDPNDVRPVNKRELYGDKDTYHRKTEVVAKFPIGKLVSSYRQRTHNGAFTTATFYRSPFFPDAYGHWGVREFYIRDGDSVIHCSMSGESSVLGTVNFRYLKMTRYSIASLPYPDRNYGRMMVDVHVEQSEWSNSRGGYVSMGTDAEFRAATTTYESAMNYIGGFPNTVFKVLWKGNVKQKAYYLAFAPLPKPATALATSAMRTISLTLNNSDQFGHSLELKDFGTLAGEAAASADSNAANMIAFVRDLKDVKSLIPKLKNLTNLKTHAGNYLGVNYGVLPTIGDLESIVDAFKKDHWTDKFGNQVLTSGQTVRGNGRVHPVQVIRRAKLIVSNEDSAISDLIKKVRSSGFYPSPQNLWDLVPYSFVLDWFIDIGSHLEKIDSNQRLAQLPILAFTSSEKTIYNVGEHLSKILPDMDVEGSLTTYSRNVSTHSPKVPLTFTSELTAQNHLIEGSALILTRK